MEPENEKENIWEIEELKEEINLLMRRIGTVEKEMALIKTNIETIRETIKRIIKELPSSMPSKYVDKGQQEDYNKRERRWFELWGVISDTEDFGD